MSSQCQRHEGRLAVRRAAVVREVVAVVARGPVALALLGAEVRAAPLLHDLEALLDRRLDLALEAVERHEIDELDVLVQRDEGLVVAAQEVDLLVVEDHRRGDRAEALGGDVVERVVGVVPVVEGEVAGELDLGLRVELEHGAGDDAQRALVLHEEVLEAVPRGALADLLGAAAADPDHLAVGQHALHADDGVGDVAVAAADERPAAAADAPADARRWRSRRGRPGRTCRAARGPR